MEHENRFNFYDDAQCKFVIEGKGGRENATELETPVFNSYVTKMR